MKTAKFFLFFNLFFYAAIIATVSFSSLLVYNYSFNDFKSLIIKLHMLLPYAFFLINAIMALVLISQSFLNMTGFYINHLIKARKKRNGYISLENISFSNSL